MLKKLHKKQLLTVKCYLMAEREVFPRISRRHFLAGGVAITGIMLEKNVHNLNRLSGILETRNYEELPVHRHIPTTMFYVCEAPSKDNKHISNVPSAWMTDWVSAFGGIDDPRHRNERHPYWPASFVPKENPFYFALPFGDYTTKGPKKHLDFIPWYRPFKDGKSILKNRWIKITHKDKIAYAQWEDVGPFKEDDRHYVFGNQRPEFKHAGLDVSPAVNDYLGLDGLANTSWQFVDESQVPHGPWTEIITTSPPKY